MLSQARLKEFLHYSPKTGVFTRNIATPQNAGKRVGTVDYLRRIRLNVDHKGYQADRLAFLYMTGAYSTVEVIHLDGDNSNNEWRNLRQSVSGEVLTRSELVRVLGYDSLTGEFFRKVSRNSKKWTNNTIKGSLQGKKPHQYQKIYVSGKYYAAHRLAFFIMTGEWPLGVVDHIDHDTRNNRWSNLRDVTSFVNGQNRRGANPDSRTGVRGVRRTGSTYSVVINGSGGSVRRRGFKSVAAAKKYVQSLDNVNIKNNPDWSRRKKRKPNPSGVVGVQKNHGSWTAYGRGKYLGTFKTIEAATAARNKVIESGPAAVKQS